MSCWDAGISSYVCMHTVEHLPQTFELFLSVAWSGFTQNH